MYTKTSIIILTHNQLKYTQICIKSIRKYSRSLKYEIIVVDNASTDQTNEWLRGQNDIKSIFNIKNMGFAAGCNQGIRIATGTEILLLNNDTIVMPNWLDNLKKALYSSEKIGAVGPVSNSCSNWQSIKVDYDNTDLLQAMKFGSLYNKSSIPQKWQKKIKLIGFCMLIKKSVVDKIGFLDERFFPGNFEDDDYSLRIIEAGYDLLQCNDTFIHHFGSMSFKEYNRQYADIFLDNKRRFFDKWGIDSISAVESLNEYNGLHLVRGMRILEIGCSCGAALLELKERCYGITIYGIEKIQRAAEIANHYFSVICGDIETMDFPYEKEFFDYIILPNLLAKVKDPERLLKRLKPYVKSGGSIVVSVYNIMHYDNIRRLLSGHWKYESNLLNDIFSENNIRFFNLYMLREIVNKSGLTINHYDSIVKKEEDIECNNQLVKFIINTNLVPNECQWELKVYRYVMYIQKKSNLINFVSNTRLNKVPSKKFLDNKIAFITCVNDEQKYSMCVASIKALNIPSKYSIEIHHINNASSMSSGYNQLMGKINAKYKVYLHQDVCIINKNFIYDILSLFKLNKNIGMIGVAGAKDISHDGIWWNADELYGCIIHNPAGGMLFKQRFEKEPLTDAYETVQAIDGNLMITQYDILWREDLFKSWHFYDMSQCMEFIKNGYKIIVPNMDDAWNIHKCGINKMIGYEHDRKIFLNEYGEYIK